MENKIIFDDTKIPHAGKGMCFKAKEIMLKELAEGKKIIVVDPNEEWERLSKILKEEDSYEYKKEII